MSNTLDWCYKQIKGYSSKYVMIRFMLFYKKNSRNWLSFFSKCPLRLKIHNKDEVSTLFQFTQLYKSEPVYSDSGGYVYELPSHINCSVWLGAAHRRRDNVRVNRSVREIKCKALSTVLTTGYCTIIRTCLYLYISYVSTCWLILHRECMSWNVVMR